MVEPSIDGQLALWVDEAAQHTDANLLSDEACTAAEDRTRRWVERALVKSTGLGFCPYTSSSELSATGLDAFGVQPASIFYSACASGEVSGLMADFWIACAGMIAEGEEGVSSVLLSAPAWDDAWDDWYRVVFPLLEQSVEAAGLDRLLGVVCFHPRYATPGDEWLSTQRFGHLHATARLREYLREHDPQLSDATDEATLAWAGAYQRRSPHACVNVLWAGQLEIAEVRRRSSTLYTRNLRTVLRRGRAALERDAADERA